MALIEGVGDEVTLLFSALLLVAVLLLAWLSTRTSEPPEHLFTGSAHSQAASPAHQEVPSTSASADANSSSSSSVLSSEAEDPAGGSGSVPEEKSEEGGGAGEKEGGGGGGGGGESAPPPPPSSPQRNMVVRLKFLNDTERTAEVEPQDTIGYIKRTYFAGQEHQVRLIYQGQLLQDDAQTLASLNLVHNCVLHCHISQHVSRAGAPGAAGAGPRPGADQVRAALNVGGLMVPLLVLMLSMLWYCQIQYRQFFTAPATASLVGVTIFISLVAFGVYRR